MDPDAAKGAPDSLLVELDGEVTTSVLGDVAWARHCRLTGHLP